MPEYGRNAGRRIASLALAASLILSGFPAAFAGVGDTNSVNDGQNVAGGTYYNTPGSETTFTNSAGTGLYVRAGDTVIGREVNDAGVLTNNGGNLHFSAPGQVVRIDGNIDVSGILKDGAYLGNGGKVVIDSAFLYQNGQIYANGINGGMVQMNTTAMTEMGPGARIEAKGLGGNGGFVSFNDKMSNPGTIVMNKGAVIDTSGAVIGTYNTNVIQMKGSIVNLDGILMANGLTPGQQGGKIDISATNNIKIGPNGQLLANGADGVSGDNPTNGGNGGEVSISAKNVDNSGLIAANGANGFNGYNPTDGGNGGTVSVKADNNLNNDGLIAANGGNGGTNPAVERGPITPDEVGNPQQTSIGQNGGNGGNGGTINVSFRGTMTNGGAIEVKGGNGGNGQEAVADNTVGAHQIANGGNGGNGGTGGDVNFNGIPSQSVLDHVNVSGGSGGQGGAAAVKSDCGCATPGAKGACGAPGKITMTPYKPPTPPNTPNTPLYPLYPREYPRLGDTLPPNTSQVLNYNRSIFLVRAPLPIIQKKPTPPPPPPAPVKPVIPKPKPKPIQKKVPVRGYW